MVGVSVAYLVALFDKMDRMPIWEIMRDDERARGNEIIIPGEVDWLTADDWDPTVVVSRRKSEIRLIAILAKNQGRGAFRRLVVGIRSAGLTPVIIAPSIEMAATMRRWQWHRRYVGSGAEQEEQWLPGKVAP